MPKSTPPEYIEIPEDTRHVVRETRLLAGLSRTTLEQQAKVGTDYLKRLELGRRPSAEAARLRRVLQVVQLAATRSKASAKLTARIARVVKAIAKPGRLTAVPSESRVEVETKVSRK
jgi:transcriptional regulator with XRE-family HTH domain